MVAAVEQIREEDQGYQIGRGKAEELSKLAGDVKADRIIFDNSLKPIQSYNLAKTTRVEVIDRFQTILEIFTKRASTKEAHLQIQLANLRYQLPRARESVRLARQGEQPGFRGLGKYEIDVYHESIKRLIAHIRSELKSIRKKRGLHRVRRRELGFSTVSLAGYTNAGKTTVFNVLARESKPINVGLFTTLSTTTRSVLFNGRKALLTDTVGFIDRLPLVLIESFNSTLEETAMSDVIVLVIDFHDAVEEIQRKLTSCLDTIREIEAGGVPIVTALNKADLLSREEVENRLFTIGKIAPNPVAISASEEMNLEELQRKIAEHLADRVTAYFTLPNREETLSLVSELHDETESINTSYKGKEMEVEISARPQFMAKIEARIRTLGGRLIENRLQNRA